MLRPLFRTVILIATITAFTQSVSATQSPTLYVQKTVDSIIATITEEQIPETQKRARVFTLIDERFDFRAMAQRALSTNWRVATSSQQQQFTQLFQEILSHTYWQRIRGHSGHAISYVKERIVEGEHANVSTVITTQAAKIPVDYRLRKIEQDWLAYDVVIEGVSLIQNYRAEYRQIIKQNGIDALLNQMRTKVDSLSSY